MQHKMERLKQGYLLNITIYLGFSDIGQADKAEKEKLCCCFFLKKDQRVELFPSRQEKRNDGTGKVLTKSD